MRKLWFGLLTIAILSNCSLFDKEKKNESADASANPNPSASIADISVPPAESLKQVSEADIEFELASMQSFFQSPELDDTSVSEGDEDFDDPFAKKLDSLKIQAQGNELIIKGEIDVDINDFTSAEEASIYEKYASKLKVLFHIICATSDLSHYNGLPSSTLNDERLCLDDAWTKTRSEVQSNFEVSFNGTEIKSQSNHANFGPEGGFCRLTKNGDSITTSDQCSIIEKTFHETKGAQLVNGEYSFFKMTTSGLNHGTNPSDQWYASGSADIQINNWQGSVAFTGSQQAPTYKLNNGQETVEGSFDDLLIDLPLNKRTLKQMILKRLRAVTHH